MKCPACKIEMVEGALVNNGLVWIKKLNNFMKSMSRFGGNRLVEAWRCPNCNKIELRTEAR